MKTTLTRAAIAAAILAALTLMGWGAASWMDSEVDRRVAEEVQRRLAVAADLLTTQQQRQPPEPESQEDYAERVERATQRLAARGETDPSSSQISLEMSMMGMEDRRRRVR